jgi:putative intracellular protease/amidase
VRRPAPPSPPWSALFSGERRLEFNSDDAKTMQVVNALIKADKKYDLLFVPGGGHGAGGAYGQRLLCDFFVHHLLVVEPPLWNKTETKSASAETQPTAR